MAIEKERKLNWLYVASLLWFGIGPVCLCLAVVFVAFYDSPLVKGMGVVDYVLISSVISFPIFCIGSSVGIRFLKVKYKQLAFYVSLLPLLPLILIFAIFIWANLSS